MVSRLLFLSLFLISRDGLGSWCFDVSQRIDTGFDRNSPLIKLDSRVHEVGLRNYNEIGGPWLALIKEKLSQNGKDQIVAQIESIERILVSEFFRHAFQNTVQHGSKELELRNFNFSVTVKTEAFFSEDELVFEIENPQIKPFPGSLKRRYFSGSGTGMRDEERVGFRGLGEAARSMVYNLRKLPRGSYLEWHADGEHVLFRLSIRANG